MNPVRSGYFDQEALMRFARVRFAAVFVVVSFAPLFAQEPDKPTTAVPRLLRVTGTFHSANGLPVGVTESATLSIYKDSQDAQPLWQETQNVSVEANGQYAAMLGSTQKDGVPLDLFSSTEPRWLGIQFNRPGEVEQPRVQLVSVPYALKASDAETLGGKPAAAYLLAPSIDSASQPSTEASATTSTAVNSKAAKPRAITGTPTTNSIVKFTDSAGDIGNSIVTDNGAGNVGIGTTTPQAGLDVAAGGIGIRGVSYTTGGAALELNMPSPNLAQISSVIGSTRAVNALGIWGSPTIFYTSAGTSRPVMSFLNSGNVGIGTSTPGSKLDVAGDINFSGSIRYNGSPLVQVSGTSNFASGPGALANNTTGAFNTATGDSALLVNTTGSDNTATGQNALRLNTAGHSNTADGMDAMEMNTTGTGNTAVGVSALVSNTVGIDNIALGDGALSFNTTGNKNIAIGFSAAVSVSAGNGNNIHIGTVGATNDANTIRIGGGTSGIADGTPQTSFFAAGIRGISTANNDAVPVLIDSAGQLGTVSSSRRYKEDIQDMGDASGGLMRLRPVTFRYQKPFADGSKPIQYGLIAEEVADVYPDLVAHSAEGQIETVKYQVLDSMLLNEVQKQQKEIGSQRDEIAQLERQIGDERRQNQALQERLSRLEAAIMTSGAGTQ